jgi:hypothetical protein
MIDSEDIPPVDESDAYKQSVREILSRGASDQHAKFLEAAEKAETDDDERRFDEKLKRLAKSPPPSDKSKDK